MSGSNTPHELRLRLEGCSTSEDSEDDSQRLHNPSETLAFSDTRRHVVVELYGNEKSYVESLQILVTKYLKALKSPDNANLLDATLVDAIFYEIPVLLSNHQTFLGEIKDRLDHWDVQQKIGDVFLQLFLNPSVTDSYTNYVNNWRKARDIIKSWQQSKPAFAKFLETTAREHRGRLALDSLLIKPIQKFPMYKLLLQRLIKYTDVTHPDHWLLLAAQKQVHEHLLKINCLRRQIVEMEQLCDIESVIDGLKDLVNPERQFIRHDLVNILGNGDTKKKESGTIRKLMMMGRPARSLHSNKYKLRMKISLEDLEIVGSRHEHFGQITMENKNLTADIRLLNRIHQQSCSLHCASNELDELLKEMLTTLNKQLAEQQSSNTQLSCLELALNTLIDQENIIMVFSKPEKRASWTVSFNHAKSSPIVPKNPTKKIK